jgi:flagellar biosynthesis/type III secretory pathway protein FliH
MKTAMQELLEWVRATLPMDLETPQMIEQKIESMIEKENQILIDLAGEHYREGYKDGWEEGANYGYNAACDR